MAIAAAKTTANTVFRAMLFICCLASMPVCAQKKISGYRLYTAQDGLPDNTVWRVLEDSKGYLWLSTPHGLSRFNGSSFQNFGQFNAGFPLRSCRELMQLNDSLLLIGTVSGMVVYNLESYRFENYRVRMPLIREGGGLSVDYMAKLPGKRLLISAGDYVVVLDEHFAPIRHRKVARHRLERYQFSSPVFLTGDSSKLLVGPDMLILDTKTLEATPNSHGIQYINFTGDRSVHAMLSASTRFLLYSYWGQGLSILDKNSRTVKQVRLHPGAGGEYNAAHHMIADRFDSSRVWISTGNGLWIFNSVTEKLEQVSLRDGSNTNMQLDFCNQLCQDRLGNTWVATNEGLVKISKHASAFERLSIEQFHQKGKDENCEFLEIVESGGSLFTGTYGNFVFKSDLQGTKVQQVGKNRIGHLVNHVVAFRDTMYVTGLFGSLYYYNRKREQFEHPRFLPKVYHDKLSVMLYFDSRGYCWTSVIGELLRIDPDNGSYRRIQYKGDSSGIPRTPFHIAEGKNGKMWFATGGWEGQLYSWDPSSGKFSLYPLTIRGRPIDNLLINSLYSDRNKNLWVSTYEFGALRIDSRTGAITQFDESNGLPSSCVNTIAEDEEGSFWFGLDAGLSVMRSKRFVNYTKNDGLQSNAIVNISFPIHSQPWRMAVLMKDAICWIDTRSLAAGMIPQKTFIEQATLDSSLLQTQGAYLPYDFQQLQFQFSSPNLNNGVSPEYVYMVEGLHKDWIKNGHSGKVSFTSLPAGTYHFLVKASDGNGGWTAPASFAFSVAPPFWQTLPFYIVCAVAAGLMFYAIYRYQLSKAIAIYRIRSRISKDLHDEVGSTLSSISLMTEMAGKGSKEPLQQKIAEGLQHVQNSMSDIVWMINPGNDGLDNLQMRFGEVAAEMLEPRGISYSLQFPEDGHHVELPMEKRREVFLVFKESLNNIIKYAGCTEVMVTLQHTKRMLVLVIADNGRGFDPSRRTSGNGLHNLKARAANLDGNIEWQTAPGSGTRVVLQFPAD